jgi:cardiolipin synthase A/B
MDEDRLPIAMPEYDLFSTGRLLAAQAFSRAAGAPLIAGNSIRLLKDATENYPAWLEAIANARKSIHLESYIIHDDEVGQRFAAALIGKQQEGIQVRLLYDWMGALGKTSRRFWRTLREAGVDVRCVNPFQWSSPLGWISRDHRKMLTVDGRVGFVTGLCIGKIWEGDPARGLAPWRDTGVEIQGPAVADLEQAFARMWDLTGTPLPKSAIPQRADLPSTGNVNLRVIASEPSTAGLYRLDTLIAAGARHSLWLTDAYFVGTTVYVQALIAAAQDGVDVRLLVPGSSDVPLVRALSRAGYRPLLEGGVKVFEWNGPMMHAKTAVADSHWARVGSTNLNPASWLGNWELDIAVEDQPFAQQMESMFLDDLQHSTEIVLSTRRRIRLSGAVEPRDIRKRRGQGSAGRAVAGALRLSHVVGAAMTNRRALGPAEARVMAGGGLLLFILALIAILWPEVVTVPLAILGLWAGVILLGRAYRLRYMRPQRPSRSSS